MPFLRGSCVLRRTKKPIDAAVDDSDPVCHRMMDECGLTRQATPVKRHWDDPSSEE